MKKFLALYMMAPIAAMEEMMKNSTPEQQKAGMDAWMDWQKKNESSIVEMGAPLGKTKKITAEGTSDTKNDIGGYSIVQAESVDDAAKIFVDNPHFKMAPGASVELMEIMSMPGM